MYLLPAVNSSHMYQGIWWRLGFFIGSWESHKICEWQMVRGFWGLSCWLCWFNWNLSLSFSFLLTFVLGLLFLPSSSPYTFLSFMCCLCEILPYLIFFCSSSWFSPLIPNPPTSWSANPSVSNSTVTSHISDLWFLYSLLHGTSFCNLFCITHNF